jgi:hypothetical protein
VRPMSTALALAGSLLNHKLLNRNALITEPYARRGISRLASSLRYRFGTLHAVKFDQL